MNADWRSGPFAGVGQATTIAPTEPRPRGPFTRNKPQRARPPAARAPMGFRVPEPAQSRRTEMPYRVAAATRGKDDWADQGTYDVAEVAEARAQAWRDAGRDARVTEAAPPPEAAHADVAALQARIAQLEAEKARQDAELETIRGAVEPASAPAPEAPAPTAPAEATPAGEASADAGSATPPTGSE